MCKSNINLKKACCLVRSVLARVVQFGAHHLDDQVKAFKVKVSMDNGL